MKVKSEYIPEQLVEKIRSQNDAFRKFKELTEEWVGLALLIGKFETERDKKMIKKQG